MDVGFGWGGRGALKKKNVSFLIYLIFLQIFNLAFKKFQGAHFTTDSYQIPTNMYDLL